MKRLFIFIFCSAGLQVLFSQSISIEKIYQTQKDVFIDIYLETDKKIKVSEYDILMENDQYITPFGASQRNYICIYKKNEDNNYQLILTNWFYDEIYEYLKYYIVIPRNGIKYNLVEFSGYKNIIIHIPRCYNNETEYRKITSVKVVFFYNIIDYEKYEILKTEKKCDITVYDLRNVYWKNEYCPEQLFDESGYIDLNKLRE